MTPRDAALSYVRAGLSVIPIARDGSKAPEGRLLPKELDPDTGGCKTTWNPYKERLPTAVELRRWFDRPDPPGVAIVCGAVSGGLELIDFDRDAEAIYPQWCALVEAEARGLLARLCVVRTPRQPVGFHVYYRCADAPVPGNSKLAADPSRPAKDRTLIETRGEGGYALAPGCPASCHSTAGLYEHHAGPGLADLAAIAAAEREVLIRCARSFDLNSPARPAAAGLAGDDARPGSAFCRNGPDWAEILTPHGWELAGGGPGGERRWRRPGKGGRGWSATTGGCSTEARGDLFRVFSSNADPFEDGHAYSKFEAHALLNHGGDFKAAAKDLAGRGYGAPHQKNGRAAPPPAQAGQGGAGGGRVFKPSVACSQLRAVDPAKEWLWRGFLESEGVTLFSALWKAGKTTLLAHLLRAFGEGGVFLGGAVTPARVLYVTEESQARWAKRRDALGLGDWIRFRVQPFTHKPDFAAWFAFLDDLKREVDRDKVGLVVFDTLDKLWPVLKENDAGEVTSALMPLRALPAASLLAHHLKKCDSKEATASRGSGALTAFVDTIIEMRRYNPDDRGCRRRVLSGYGRSDEVPAELVVELARDGEQYLVHGDRAEASASDLDGVIRGLLAKGPEGLSQAEILDEWPEGRPAPRRETLSNALKAGFEKGRWRREGKGKKGDPYRYFSVPDDADAGGRGQNREQNSRPAGVDATTNGESNLGPNGPAGDGFCSRPAAPGVENGNRIRDPDLDTHRLFPNDGD